MKVYAKKVDGVASPELTIFVGLIFSGLPLCYLLYLLNLFISDNDSFFELLLHDSIPLFFSLFFFYIGSKIVLSIIKRPIKQVAKLTKKVNSNYNGKAVVMMTFTIFDGEEYSYDCYTLEDNELIVGNNYIIFVKESFLRVKKVMPYDTSITINTTAKNPYPNSKEGMKIVSNGIIFIFVGPVILAWTKVLFDLFNNNYDSNVMSPLITFTLFVILIIINAKKQSNSNRM